MKSSLDKRSTGIFLSDIGANLNPIGAIDRVSISDRGLAEDRREDCRVTPEFMLKDSLYHVTARGNDSTCKCDPML